MHKVLSHHKHTHAHTHTHTNSKSSSMNTLVTMIIKTRNATERMFGVEYAVEQFWMRCSTCKYLKLTWVLYHLTCYKRNYIYTTLDKLENHLFRREFITTPEQDDQNSGKEASDNTESIHNAENVHEVLQCVLYGCT